MKLRNKKTGEIMEFDAILPVKDVLGDSVAHLEYDSLAKLNEEWEDAPEEPKEYWYINEFGTPTKADFVGRETLYDKCRKNFVNYFETKEEAEKAVEKLKAWKRLKDKGISFGMRRHSHYGGEMFWNCANGLGISDKQIWKDLDLLFRGEE